MIIDMQNDFCEGGPLGLVGTDEIIKEINSIRTSHPFDMVVTTRDWHPTDHISFNTPKEYEFDQNELDATTRKYIGAFPVHCVQNTKGAEYHSDLIIESSDYEVLKGKLKLREEFSPFAAEDVKLAEVLKAKEITKLIIVGVAYDFCVMSGALDAIYNGFSTVVVSNATLSLDPDLEKTTKKLEDAGVCVVKSEELQ